MGELSRQLVHLSALVFVLFTLFMDKLLISVYFFMIAFSLLLYSFIIRKQQNNFIKTIHKLEKSFKYLVSNFERQETKVPFIGAFWLYFSCGLLLLLFPLIIALVSCSIVAVADSVSTIIGSNFGKHKIVGNKSLEGSLAFFISAFIVVFLFTDLNIAVLVSGAATIAELLPDMKIFRKLKKKEILDDNFTVPIITGILLLIIL